MLHKLQNWFRGSKPSQRARRGQPSFRPSLEALEQRVVRSTLSTSILAAGLSHVQSSGFLLVVTSPQDSGPGSLRALVNQANYDAYQGRSDTIVFDSSLQGSTIALSQDLEVARGWGTVTIDGGQNQISLSGGGLTELFCVDRGASLKLNNLTLENGSGAFGGAIENCGMLSLSFCTFQNNGSSSGSGGAIWNDGSSQGGGSLSAANCTFQNNSAGYFGGAIFIDQGASAGLVSCTFTSNTVNLMGGSGGAIYEGLGSLTAYWCTFWTNTATTSGGAIYIGSNSSANASSCKFYVNKAGDNSQGGLGVGGGAIFNSGGLIASSDTFTSNSGANGGAIYNWEGTVLVSGSTFGGDYTPYSIGGSGGAIYNYFGTVSVDTSSFSYCEADGGGDGGAAFNLGTMSFSNCTFSENYAVRGGAIYNGVWASLTTSNCAFQNNSAFDGPDIYYEPLVWW
jgi:predicted outer membrane repeat protein